MAKLVSGTLRMYRRHGMVVYVLGAAVTAVLYALAPPTEAVGATAGWAIAAAILLSLIAMAIRMAVPSTKLSIADMSTVSFVNAAQIGVLQWLAGGLDAPYNQLLLLSVFSSASVHTRKRLIAYLALVTDVVLAPFAYDGWDAQVAGATIVQIVLFYGVAAISHSFVRQTDQQKAGLRKKEREAEAIARSDPMTGLGNRRAFDEMLDQEVARSRRTGVPLSLIVADVDDFKAVNDRFGHLTGDELLRAVAAALEGAIRRSDRCFRWGGDEFAIVLPDTSLPATRHVEGRVRAAVAGCTAPDDSRITLSSAAAELAEGMTPADLLAMADAAMLATKPSRRGTTLDVV